MTLAASPLGIDPYGFASTHLSDAARGVLARLAATLERDVRPLMSEAWETATMPAAVRTTLAALRLMDPPELDETEAASSMYAGFRNYVLARADVSVATAYNAQSGLFRTAVTLGGSPEQARELDSRVRSFDLVGAFALTEPDHGSDIAKGLATTARRDGAHWVIDGAKSWIGGADTADVLAVFARDVASGDIRAFLVDRTAPGVTLETMRGKVALRPMQNARITLEGVRVSDDARLGGVEGWADVARLLRAMRADVAWIATGLQAGALDAATAYVGRRAQFDRPVASFALVQEKLARMLGNLTASLGMVVQLSARQDAGDYRDENSALAKMWTALHARETAALGRELLGGNGLLLEHDAARFFADAEAVYSYEGTHEITSLIVGRALTGHSAFL
jgi:glutaryl-CoA dehydrogenase